MPKAGIPDSQRAALRHYYAEQVSQGKVFQKQYVEWFKCQYQRTLTQSTVFESLSTK